MAKQTNKPAGGIGSKVNVSVPQRLGQKATGINPGGPAQLGSAVGNKVTDGRTTNYRGDPWTDGRVPAGGAQRLGNQVATNVGKGGPGTGRTVMGGGSQGQYGAAAPGNPPPSGELFPGFPTKERP
jgi:hypothetical protein